MNSQTKDSMQCGTHRIKQKRQVFGHIMWSYHEIAKSYKLKDCSWWVPPREAEIWEKKRNIKTYKNKNQQIIMPHLYYTFELHRPMKSFNSGIQMKLVWVDKWDKIGLGWTVGECVSPLAIIGGNVFMLSYIYIYIF